MPLLSRQDVRIRLSCTVYAQPRLRSLTLPIKRCMLQILEDWSDTQSTDDFAGTTCQCDRLPLADTNDFFKANSERMLLNDFVNVGVDSRDRLND
jgi:hypothetical protein